MTEIKQNLLPLRDFFGDIGDDWTFKGASTRELTHCYHDYPARMIPQVAAKLLNRFGRNAQLLFDPYCGTGTSLVEGMIRGINVIGTDINPLARLIAAGKTSIPDRQKLDRRIKKFYRYIDAWTDSQIASAGRGGNRNGRTDPGALTISGISRLDFWFKPIVAAKLSYIRRFVDHIEDSSAKTFFQIAFSETVRESSNTRVGEFKLYRYDEATLKKFNPDVFQIMVSKIRRNVAGLDAFAACIHKIGRVASSTIHDFNTVEPIPFECVEPSSVDIVVTSPPYGDSHTTVAYGQYSRLSTAWLGLSEDRSVDSKLMGGRIYKQMSRFPCDEINVALQAIRSQDEKRSNEVASFYFDLQKSIANVSNVIRRGGYTCYVVGNRRVKGITLPTNEVVRRFFETNSFKHVQTFVRSIPNKRMPVRNSPTNIAGAIDTTMMNEYIVVMQKA